MNPITRTTVWLLVCAVWFETTGCSEPPRSGLSVSARDFETADAMFHAEPRWLGGDGALSVPLDAQRTLWMFGDSFVATSPANVRGESKMIRNTVAIQDGLNPHGASVRFHWNLDPDGSPAPIFADEGDRWFWPGHGVRLDEGPLLLFLMAVRGTPDEGLGFTEAGYRVVLVDDPEAPVEQWSLETFDPPSPSVDPNATLGLAVLREGPWVYAYANARGAEHVGWLARLAVEDVMARRIAPAWWTGEDWATVEVLGDRPPAVVIDDIGAECSVHFEPRTNAYLHVASRGFGATTIAVRTAPALTGPFTAAQQVFTPAESLEPEPFVYAAKAHPQLVTDDPQELLITYATNTFDFWALFSEPGLTRYWPRFVRLRLERR
ncbi:MAG: DUF4185 domain-containing protein [Deltaproteobacteria bacterium]|nr:DUF4185 domain-containing protein [Deltaproteobacteria bacterium]